jgi:hypothetical protein
LENVTTQDAEVSFRLSIPNATNEFSPNPINRLQSRMARSSNVYIQKTRENKSFAKDKIEMQYQPTPFLDVIVVSSDCKLCIALFCVGDEDSNETNQAA